MSKIEELKTTPSEKKKEESMKKLNIAYVGFGKSTNRYHIPYVKIREHFNIARIVNRSLGKRPEQAILEAEGTIFQQTSMILFKMIQLI